MKRCFQFVVPGFIVAVLAATAVAQVKSPGPAEPEKFYFTVDPAAEPRPALKYRLLPRATERKPGNAAPYYYRALVLFQQADRNGKGETEQGLSVRLSKWLELPLETMPVEEMRRTVEHLQGVFEELETGAYREKCDWEWRFEDLDGTKPIEFRLNEIQESRDLARFLAVKARLEISEGRYDEAIATLRVGFQLGQDVAKPPILISTLVGIAINYIMNRQTQELIRAQNSPNLYWAYTEFPRPLVDLRATIEFELDLPFRVFPFLKDAETAQRSPEQWADLIANAYSTISPLVNSMGAGNWQSRLSVTARALKDYPRVKRELIDAGYDRAKIERMPVGQVVAVHEAWLCRSVADEKRKWSLGTYAESGERGRETDREIDRSFNSTSSPREILPLVATLMPAAAQAREAVIRRDIDIAAMRVLEAIRMHAAVNGRKLPQSLADIHIVPVPVHPRTGEPFPYRVENGTGILEVRRNPAYLSEYPQIDQEFEIVIREQK